MKTGIKILLTLASIFVWILSELFLRISRDSITAGPLGTIIMLGAFFAIIAIWKSGKKDKNIENQKDDENDIKLKKD